MARKKPIYPPSNEVEKKPTLTESGAEILDDTPVSIPMRIVRGQYHTEQIQRLVALELSRQAGLQEFETWEESNDFDVGDDYEPTSPWEEDIDSEDRYQEDRRLFYRERYERSTPGKKDTAGGGNPQGGEGVQREGQADTGPKETGGGNQPPSGGNPA